MHARAYLSVLTDYLVWLAAWQDVAECHGGLGKEEAERFIRQLQLTGRYFVESWS